MAAESRISLWSADYETQVAALDNHHQKLLMLLRQLAQALHRGEASFTVLPLFRSIREMTSYHFQFEETQMERYGYPGIDKHRQAHRVLEAQLVELERNYKTANLGVGAPLDDFFAHWLVDHILTEDRKCAQFLRAAGFK